MPTYFGQDQPLQPKTNAPKLAIADTFSQPARQPMTGQTSTGTPSHTGQGQENSTAAKLYEDNKQGSGNLPLAMTST